MPEIHGGDPAFRDDVGAADPAAARALREFADGTGSERTALTAIDSGRLLVPVVAVLAEQLDDRLAEKSSEMAMPTLIGMDGRRAVPAFTCSEALRLWQPEARPVPVPAREVWRTAEQESCAVVIDVAGPVPLAVEGARLAALARGEPVPPPEQDPDVRAAVAEVLAHQLDVAGFQLGPGGADRDLTIGLILAPDRADSDVQRLASEVGTATMARLGSRFRRGVGFWFGTAQAS